MNRICLSMCLWLFSKSSETLLHFFPYEGGLFGWSRGFLQGSFVMFPMHSRGLSVMAPISSTVSTSTLSAKTLDKTLSLSLPVVPSGFLLCHLLFPMVNCTGVMGSNYDTDLKICCLETSLTTEISPLLFNLVSDKFLRTGHSHILFNLSQEWCSESLCFSLKLPESGCIFSLTLSTWQLLSW